MYLRTTQRRNKGRSIVRYVQVAHNRKVEGVTQAEVRLNQGREDILDRDGRPGWWPRSTAAWANPPPPGFRPTLRIGSATTCA